MINHIFDTDWHRKPPMVAGKNAENTIIDLHLYDVNTRNGWNLDESEPPSWADRWVPWVLAAAMVVTVIIVKWM